MVQIVEVLFDRKENIMLVTSIFSFFPQGFQKFFPQGLTDSTLFGKKLKLGILKNILSPRNFFKIREQSQELGGGVVR